MSDVRSRATSGARLPRPRSRDRTDAELIEACLADDQAAWRELVTRYSRLVLAVTRREGLAEADADDVFQVVFTALLEQLPRLRDRGSLAKWLITTSHRTAWRHAQQRGLVVPPEHDRASGHDPPPEQVLRWEREHLVRHALRRLGGRCERLLGALYLDPDRPDYDTVARRLGIPRGSIGPTRSRCLTRLVELLRAMRPPTPQEPEIGP